MPVPHLQEHLGYSSLFFLSLLGSMEKPSWDFDWNCIESINQIGGESASFLILTLPKHEYNESFHLSIFQ